MKANAAKEKGEKEKKPEPLDPKNYIINIKPRDKTKVDALLAEEVGRMMKDVKTDAKKPTVTSTGMGNKY